MENHQSEQMILAGSRFLWHKVVGTLPLLFTRDHQNQHKIKAPFSCFKCAVYLEVIVMLRQMKPLFKGALWDWTLIAAALQIIPCYSYS